MTPPRAVPAGSLPYALRDVVGRSRSPKGRPLSDAREAFVRRGAEKDTDKQQLGAKVNDSGFRVAPAGHDRARPVETASQTVNMLKKIRRDFLPERIEHELHAFPPCELCRRNKISIAGNENDNFRLTSQCDRCDVETDSHIDPLLSQGRREVVIGKVFNRKAAGQKLLLRLRFQNPGSVTVLTNLAQTHGKIWRAAQDIEESLSKERLEQPVAKAPLHSSSDASRLNCVAPRSNMSNMLPRRALSAGRLAALGATHGFTTDC